MRGITPTKLLAIYLFLFCFRASCAAQTQLRPHLTRVQVTEAINQFCQKVGVENVTNPTFVFPASNPPMGIQRTFWSAKAGNCEFLVADDNGEVVEYSDDSTSDRLSSHVKGPDGQETYADILPPKKLLSQAEVRAKSQVLLERLDLRKQVVFDSADNGPDGHIGSEGHTWLIRYRRESKGVYYWLQGVTLQYDNDTGQLFGFFLNFTTREYKATTTPKITAEQATAIAKQKMVEINFEYDEERGKPSLAIQDAGPSAQGGVHDCRLCWVVFLIQHRSRTIYYNRVFVDAERGVILNIYKIAGRNPNAPPLMPPPTLP